MLFLFLRSGLVLRVTARLRPASIMEFATRYQRKVSRLIFYFTGAFAGMRMGIEQFPGTLPPVMLIITNHQSLVDIPALAMAFPRHALRWVAKKELGRKIPYISANLRIGRHALISRTKDYREGHRELVRFAKLGEEGICPVVFPEGTRSRTGYVQGFHAGAVRIILETMRLPVLSVAVDGGYRIATVMKVLVHLRNTIYRIKPLTLFPPPRGKKEIADLLGKVEREIAGQILTWRKEEREEQARGRER